MPGLAKTFVTIGVPAVKYLPDEISWGKIQPTENSPLDFSRMDRYVKEYQNAGFKELWITLKTRDSWAVVDPRNNFSPKPEYLDAYEAWVRAVVERYDMDGNDDMPGLKSPVKYYEIGSEFSSYEPEPVSDYITMLERAYRGAHDASDNVIVMHAPFLVTTAFKDHPGPEQYEDSFKVVDKRIMTHSLEDIRSILDRQDIFDAVNFHSLGDPYEIEDTVKWLNYEMKQRGYHKSIVISDTAATPFIAWGPATIYKGSPSQLGIIIPPATEKDRFRLSEYFQKLVDGDEETVRWTQSFAASEMVKKVVVAAEQNVALINVAFMEDLTPLKMKIFMASAGTSPWGGMALTEVNLFTQEHTIKELRPLFYALGQFASHINGYTSLERIPVSDARVRLYKFVINNDPLWIGWFEPGEVILPDDSVPQVKFSLETGISSVIVESMINRYGQTSPEQQLIQTKDGILEVELTPTPIFILAKDKPF